MPRVYIKKVGPSQLLKYPKEEMEAAVKKVRSGISLRKAAEMVGVPRTILRDKVKNLHPFPHGRPSVLSQLEEKQLVEGLIICCEWGCPLTTEDVRDVVQAYLNKCGRREKLFIDNKPGREWVKAFLRRNTVLSERFCENIKRKRAEVSPAVINSYFDKLEMSLFDIPPENIINYDETNFTDDPGSDKVIVKRGMRHPERIIDTSKSSISVMFAIVANGTLLPPYIVYKAVHLYDTWTENGVYGARYNRSSFGWFDMNLFEDWFLKICLPYLKNKQGPKAVIGDNLASHLSLTVVQMCAKNDIRFILLPPNATHLMQPLDVAFFHPLKKAWRKELTTWKQKNRGVVSKAAFPSLLKKALSKIKANEKQNIKSGFKACGIVSVDRTAVLKKLPGYRNSNSDPQKEKNWSYVLMEKLQNERFSTSANVKEILRHPRCKRLRLEPGESVSSEQLFPPVETERGQKIRKRATKKKPETETNIRVMQENTQKEAQTKEHEEKIKDKAFVLVKILTAQCKSREKIYVGQVITNLDTSTYEINFMRKHIGQKDLYFVFPDVPDVANIKQEDIKKILRLKGEKRGRYRFAELEDCQTLF